MRRALLVAALLAGCGVKAPPRPPGPDRSAAEPNRSAAEPPTPTSSAAPASTPTSTANPKP